MLPFSDHADYEELVRTARESGASKVYTVHGPATFADRLRALGIDAEHLMEHPNEAEPEPDEGPAPVKPGEQLGFAL